MGAYNSIEEMRNDPSLRKLIKESINRIYDMQDEYYENVKEVKRVNVSSQVIGSNEVDSGGGVMIGKGEKGVVISQRTNLQTEIQTMYYGNFLSTSGESDEPTEHNSIIQLISSDMLGMTAKDNSDKEMPNFYDAMFVMKEMLGYGENVVKAEFDFDNEGVRYVVASANGESNGESNGENEQFITFEELYDMLADRYLMNLEEKLSTIREKIKNIKTNITRSTYNYASNRVSINGNLEDANIKQDNTAIQKMYDGFERVANDVDKFVERVNVENEDTINTEQKEKKEQKWTSGEKDEVGDYNLKVDKSLIVIILLACGLILFASIVCYKRKVDGINNYIENNV